jgi:hypothetical protein
VTKLFAQVLSKLGTIKNELLVFVVLTTIVTHGVAYFLSYSGVGWKEVCGVVMHFISIANAFGFAAFYLYALLQLPSSDQEFLFASSAKRTMAEHDRRGRSRRAPAKAVADRPPP